MPERWIEQGLLPEQKEGLAKFSEARDRGDQTPSSPSIRSLFEPQSPRVRKKMRERF